MSWLKINVSGTSSIPIIRIWCRSSSRLSHIYTCPVPVFEAEREPMGASGQLSLALLPDWCVFILFEHVHHQVPGPTESETNVPVEVLSGGAWDLSSLFYCTVHISCGLSRMDMFLKSMLCPISHLCSAWQTSLAGHLRKTFRQNV
jgi:hypothetical protein